jgi:hypothetical protein
VLVDSLPPGATVYLDGEPMRLASGGFAKTPIEVGPLSSAQTYQLELRKEGYAPYAETLRINEELDGARLRPRLSPRPGRLRIRAEGERERTARLVVDGRVVGRGPELVREMPGETSAHIEARLADHQCRATPATITIPPGGEAEVEVTCAPIPPPELATVPAPRSTRGARFAPGKRAPAPGPAAAKSSSSCAPRPDLPPGFVTIDTRPHSEIFWNGRRLGETPLAQYELPAGCVELEARGETAKKRFKVRVEPNQVAIYRLELAP